MCVDRVRRPAHVGPREADVDNEEEEEEEKEEEEEQEEVEEAIQFLLFPNDGEACPRNRIGVVGCLLCVFCPH
jgi:hypothetical protein